MDDVFILDHGAPGAQELGSAAIPAAAFQEIAPYLDDEARIVLWGCKVGQVSDYGNQIADYAAPNAVVWAPDDFGYSIIGLAEGRFYTIGHFMDEANPVYPDQFVAGRFADFHGLSPE